MTCARRRHVIGDAYQERYRSCTSNILLLLYRAKYTTSMKICRLVLQVLMEEPAFRPSGAAHVVAVAAAAFLLSNKIKIPQRLAKLIGQKCKRLKNQRASRESSSSQKKTIIKVQNLCVKSVEDWVSYSYPTQADTSGPTERRR